MADIKTWQRRCEEDPAHDGIVTHAMIEAKMQDEIEDLRAALAEPEPSREPTQEQVDAWRSNARRFHADDAEPRELWEFTEHELLRFAKNAYAAGIKAGSGT